MSPNRIVAILTPLVFAPLAGVISTWAAENLPGVQISQSAMEEIFVAGALIALAPALQWLYGWQKHEARAADALAAAATVLTPPEPAVAPLGAPFGPGRRRQSEIGDKTRCGMGMGREHNCCTHIYLLKPIQVTVIGD
jgi:hypothetical protein